MSIDLDSSFEIEDSGISGSNSDGEVKYYYTGGTGEPTGSPAPINTYYTDSLTMNVWKKYGPNDEDWILNNGTFEKLTLTQNYTVPNNIFTKLNCPTIEGILCVEGILEII